jgi:hypothetical protein
MGIQECTGFFVRKKYTTFSTERFVALRSVNLFQESNNFTASLLPPCSISPHLVSRVTCRQSQYGNDILTKSMKQISQHVSQ